MTQPMMPESVIYFCDWRSDDRFIKIGVTSHWLQRKAAHEAEGGSMIALMPGSRDMEQRMHNELAPHRADLVRKKEIYECRAVAPYVEGLVMRGYASCDEHDVAHIPLLPWDAISPAAVLGTSAGQYLFGPADMAPRHRQERLPGMPLVDALRRSTKYACYSSQTDEWYTPPAIIEAARRAMGTIDLDPAPCPSANAVVGARAYYSERISGLDERHPWTGNVWMNPPYGGNAEQFVRRLMREYDSGRVTQAIVLLSSQAIVTKWADDAVRKASAIGVSRGRWEFRPGNGQVISSPAGGSSLLYYGQRVREFCSAFDSLAHVMTPAWLRD